MKSLDHAVIMNNPYVVSTMKQALPTAGMQEERLPFTVRVVRSDDALLKAVSIRQAAYARHVPEFAAKLGAPEPNDYEPDCTVLLAESRMDGSPLGTMRIQTNRFNDLVITQSVDLPDWLEGRSMAEATRLGVAHGSAGRVVKMVLCKAFYLYSLAANIEWMVIAARPPLDRPYEAALFQDVYPGELVPLRHANNIPHRVLAFEVGTAAERWTAAKHPLAKFMLHTWHPDIDLSGADYSLPSHIGHRPAFRDRVAISA